MQNDELEPVLVRKYKEDSAPIVVSNVEIKNDEDLVVLKKRKTNIRSITIDTSFRTNTAKVRIKDLANNLEAFFRSKGYETSDSRIKCFIASMLSSKLIFVNSDSNDVIKLLFEYFGTEENKSGDDDLRKITSSEALKTCFKARYNSDAIHLVVLESDNDDYITQFGEYIKAPYSHSVINCDVIINDLRYRRLLIPENVWIIVKTKNDSELSLREYGSYSKLILNRAPVDISDIKIPSYKSFKDAFIDASIDDEDLWTMLDEIIALIEGDKKMSNRDLNMIDDYLTSLYLMGMDKYDALDYTILNKILYITGNDKIVNLKDYKNLGLLNNTKRKVDRY